VIDQHDQLLGSTSPARVNDRSSQSECVTRNWIELNHRATMTPATCHSAGPRVSICCQEVMIKTLGNLDHGANESGHDQLQGVGFRHHSLHWSRPSGCSVPPISRRCTAINRSDTP